MAESFDVSARLADGRAAVDNVGEYVWACHLVGYQNPDLTLHAAQVRDWYGSEDGLDLRALEADRAALDAAATAAASAQRLQEEQLGALAGAWQGRGGDATREFLLRHGAASAAAASAVLDAAHALAALRDDLWRAVDDKVGAAMAIEERRQADRAEWLGATRAVTTGVGDRSAASELIDQQVKPFVDNDIRADWLAAMQRGMAAVSAAFDDATSVLTSEAVAPFEVPGDLGPTPVTAPSIAAPPTEAAGTAPAAWTGSPPAAVAPGFGPAVAPAPAIPAAPEPLAAALPAAPAPAAAPLSATPSMPQVPPMPSLGEMGGGLPGAGGGLTGLGSQLADAIGGLIDRPDDGLPDPPQLDDETIDGPGIDDEEAVPDEDGEDVEDESSTETDDLAGSDEPAEEPVDACTEEPVDDDPPGDPASTPPPTPLPPPPQPIVEPPPTAEAIGAETPCEIAADELPQAGP